MGKSRAKWIKTLLLWKKSSNSNLLKEKEKLNCAHKGEVLASKVTSSELLADHQSISAPILNNASNFEDSKKGIPTQLPKSGTNSPSSQVAGNDNAISNFGKPEDPERIRLDRAAAKAQAAFRDYLVAYSLYKTKQHYCLFDLIWHLGGNVGLCRSASCIVLMDKSCSFIDGNVICWKACWAFQTLKGIKRLQALIRGHLVRRQAVATLCCTWGIVKFQALARGQKLLASSPSASPLRLQYGPWNLTRYGSGFEVENGACLTSDHEKPKCGVSRVSGNSTADTVLEHPQNELEKVKRALKRLTAKEVSKKSEVVSDKTTQNLTRTTDASNVSEQEFNEKMMRDVSTPLSKPSNLHADLRLSQEDTSLDKPNVSPAADLASAENNDKIETMLVPEESSSKDEKISDMSSKKLNQRRASFPAKTGNLEENGLNKKPKVPSYMLPTESVKARLRNQGSQMSGACEVDHKNWLNRRYSLSPGAQRPAHVAGKGIRWLEQSGGGNSHTRRRFMFSCSSRS
ncbi:hypothetical protein F3Y22_tig00110384pilonHSYRG00630 [Hibiscus syriacus]|uniref:DUF4005 domain-containing protein n=1 Tax=Hibiscus syriacus TaxID=106335 RepID=A0A6A3AVD7_HIBSY|nr:hypothetical protein F3Y22_tig00110384pilonHSYRG00630 [Hibiscus syriacus]